MGMSASQGRLLFIKAALSDNALKAQFIMSEKIALATQKDDAYEAYCNALEKTQLKVACNIGGTIPGYVDANFSSLCTYNENMTRQYTLRNNDTGHIVVSDDVKETYDAYDNDKYAFAYAMMGFESEESAKIGINKDDSSSLYMTRAEESVFNSKKDTDPKLLSLYEKIETSEGELKQEALNEFRDYLYSKYASSIYNANKFGQININSGSVSQSVDKTSVNKDFNQGENKTWDDIKGEFNYYVNLWQAINEAGGCQAIPAGYENGDEGNEWLNNMVNAGLITIMSWDATGGKGNWSDTSIATSINSNFLQEEPDKKELARIEQEYTHTLDVINRKDTEFDQELSKLETKKKSYETMEQSTKKAIEENTQRTFKIFS
jgi:hypothetical protein